MFSFILFLFKFIPFKCIQISKKLFFLVFFFYKSCSRNSPSVLPGAAECHFIIFQTKFSVTLLLMCNSQLMLRKFKWLSRAWEFFCPLSSTNIQSGWWNMSSGRCFFTAMPVTPHRAGREFMHIEIQLAQNNLGRGQIHFVMKHFLFYFRQ